MIVDSIRSNQFPSTTGAGSDDIRNVPVFHIRTGHDRDSTVPLCCIYGTVAQSQGTRGGCRHGLTNTRDGGRGRCHGIRGMCVRGANGTGVAPAAAVQSNCCHAQRHERYSLFHSGSQVVRLSNDRGSISLFERDMQAYNCNFFRYEWK